MAGAGLGPHKCCVASLQPREAGLEGGRAAEWQQPSYVRQRARRRSVVQGHGAQHGYTLIVHI